MKLSFMLVVFSFLLVTSCGNETSQNQDAANQEEQTVEGRYRDIELIAEGFFQEYSHKISINMTETPLRIRGLLNSEEENATCELNLTLSTSQSELLIKLSEDLELCTFRTDSDIIIDTITNAIALTPIEGQTTYGNKDLSGQDGEVYLCRGKTPFYNYIKQLTQAQMQRSSCPKKAVAAIF